MLKCDNCDLNLSKVDVMFYDIIKIKGNFYAEHCLVPFDSGEIMNLDPFYDFVSKKYNCNQDDIESLFMDGLDISREELDKLPYGLESCGGHCPNCDSSL